METQSSIIPDNNIEIISNFELESIGNRKFLLLEANHYQIDENEKFVINLWLYISLHCSPLLSNRSS